MSKPDGTYPGQIAAVYVAEDQWDAGKYVLKLDVNLEGGGAVTCRVKLSGGKEEIERRDAALNVLGLPWPFKSADLGPVKGQGVDVRLKTSVKGRQNAYLATYREERVLTPEEVDAALGDELPF